MIDTTISVSPPRIELNSFSENKKVDTKDKKEFSNYLDKSLEKQAKPKEDQTSSGEMKKKSDGKDDLLVKGKEKLSDEVVAKEGKEDKEKDVNEEMVLLSMVSPESVNKIPNTEENLDSLEVVPQVDLENSTNPLENILASASESEIPAETITAAQDNPSELVSDEMQAIVQNSTEEVIPQDSILTMEGLKLPAQEAVASSKKMSATLEDVQSEQPSMLSAQNVTEQSQSTKLQAEVAPAALSSEIDSQVLETLKRDQMFQKLNDISQQTAGKAVSADVVQQVDSTAQFLEQRGDQTSFVKEQKNEGQSQLQKDDKEAFSIEADPQLAVGEGHARPRELHVSNEVGALKPSDSTTPSDSDMSENIKEIMSQARFMVNKGGGEVTVKMTPEGMGEVHLKMMLENGKMNLQLNTQDKNIQKMIQDSLSDLKASLASHQISVEHVTINDRMSSVQKTNSENSSQFQNLENFGRDQQQQQQAKFGWDQSRDSQERRNLFGEKSSGGGIKDVVSTAQDVRKAVGQRVYQSNKAQTLNAVA